VKFLLDENVPISSKKPIKALGYEALTLHDFNKLGIQNGEVAELALKENAIIITLDSDFLQLSESLQKKCRIIYIKIHPRDPKKIRELIQHNLKEIVPKLTKPCKLIVTEENIFFDEF
jgi:predicted nuclease of predicted toxin-antitoxin system